MTGTSFHPCPAPRLVQPVGKEPACGQSPNQATKKGTIHRPALELKQKKGGIHGLAGRPIADVAMGLLFVGPPGSP